MCQGSWTQKALAAMDWLLFLALSPDGVRLPQRARFWFLFPLTTASSVISFFGALLREQPGGMKPVLELCSELPSAEYSVSSLASFTFYKAQDHPHSVPTVTATLGQAPHFLPRPLRMALPICTPTQIPLTHTYVFSRTWRLPAAALFSPSSHRNRP